MFYRVLFIYLLLTQTVMASTVKLELFTNTHYGVKNQSVAQHRDFKLKVYDLDAHMQIDRYLSAKLPNNEVKAKQIVREKVAKIPMKTLQESWQGISRAANFGLHSLPAIVVNDGEAVLYGITNIDIAIKQYLLWKKSIKNTKN